MTIVNEQQAVPLDLPDTSAYGEAALFNAACLNAAVHVGTPEDMLVPMAILNPDKGGRYVAVAAAGTAVGALGSYLVGLVLFQLVQTLLLEQYGLEPMFAQVQAWYHSFQAVILIAGGFSPLPISIFTATSGFFSGNLLLFLGLVIMARSARFGVICWLIWRGGARYKEWLERNLYGLTMALSVGVMLLAVLVRYVWSRV